VEGLIRACSETGEPEAWEEFIQRYNPVISGVVFRTACRWGEPAHGAIDDLVQETYLKLCANRGQMLRNFEFRHSDSLFGFLKVVAANVVNDHFKSLNTVKRGAGLMSDGSAEVESIPADQRDQLSLLERGILLDEIDSLLRSRASEPCHERDRTIFWLYYRQGLTARQIASISAVGLSAKGVESTILRLTRLVRENLAQPCDRAGADDRQARAADWI
jgi:RNA polymerase sigma-70 factor (ECF subfamily)